MIFCIDPASERAGGSAARWQVEDEKTRIMSTTIPMITKFLVGEEKKKKKKGKKKHTKY